MPRMPECYRAPGLPARMVAGSPGFFARAVGDGCAQVNSRCWRTHEIDRRTGTERFEIGDGGVEDALERLAAVEGIVGGEDHVVAGQEDAVARRGAKLLQGMQLVQKLFLFLDQFFPP